MFVPVSMTLLDFCVFISVQLSKPFYELKWFISRYFGVFYIDNESDLPAHAAF